MPNSALRTSLQALTESFTDSVMTAIRGASLEELLGEAPRDYGRPTSASTRAAKADRAPSSASQLEGLPGGHASAPPAAARSRRSGPSAATGRVRTPSQSPPAPAAEITDPQALLSMEASPSVEVVAKESARSRVPEGPASTVRAVGEGSPVRLRANETLARVSNAGIVIRRAK